MPQLTFKWPMHTSYAAEDFIISESNAEAIQFLDTWPDGNSYAAILSGPPSAGKTHLVQRWASRVEAGAIDKTALGAMPSSQIWNQSRHNVLEDIHTITDETALFHLLRHAETHGVFLLLSARMTALQLPFTLPDLRSRLLALPSIHLASPDEILLHGFLLKCFADRQLRVSEDVTAYLAKRMERSFASALALVDRIERSSFETKREITIPLVKPLVETL
jgi:chromosomal replication initiation ATPase DnaA